MNFVFDFVLYLDFDIFRVIFLLVFVLVSLCRVKPSLAWSEPERLSIGWKPFWIVNSTILSRPKVCGISWTLPTFSKMELLFASKFKSPFNSCTVCRGICGMFPHLAIALNAVEYKEKESYPPIHQVSCDRAKENLCTELAASNSSFSFRSSAQRDQNLPTCG
jgi:hypothetical protein